MNYESENTEFKLKMSDDIYKEVIAFANTNGGTVYTGVDDSGNIVGIDNIDDTYTHIANGIRDAIWPDVTMFIKYALQDNRVICIEVSEGSSKPYYLKSKGIKPSGVFIRQGASSVQASFEQIRQMIKNTDGDVFEAMRSMEQGLTFSSASKAFAKYKVDFTEDKYAALGLCSIYDDLYTNLAWILSDQCQHTTKLAVFADEENTVFKDSREFGGSVFEQLENAYSYLMLCNRTVSVFQGLERIEKQDYPEAALREALLNAIVHRDYSFSGSIIININDSCIEFISLGGLLPGLSKEDIQSGISQPRNRSLAEVFHRIKLIESYGTGIRRIFNLYQGNSRQPKIEVTPNTFKLILPNMNFEAAADKEDFSKSNRIYVTPQMKIVLDYLSEYGEIGEEGLQELLNVKRTRAYLVARQMCETGLIVTTGRGVSKKYKLK